MLKKTTLTVLLSLSIGLNLFSSQGYAQDFQINTDDDKGTEAILIAQEQAEPVMGSRFVSAEEQAMDFVIDKFGREGWDPEKQRMIIVHSEGWNTEDPAFDTDFASKRALYSTISSMGARAKIIEFMRTQMSAKDLLKAPPNDVYAELSAQHDEAIAEFEKQKRRVSKLLEQYNEQEAQSLAGASWSDKGKSLLDAMIKKLDQEYDLNKLDQKYQTRFQETKQEYAQAITKLEEIESKADSLKGSIASTASSSVKTIASGALVGANVIATSESYNPDEEIYEVASVVVWSPKLKASALALLSGKVERLKPKPGRTLESWLQKQDIGSLIGPRQLIDENGQRWFIGVYAQDYRGTASKKRQARGLSEMYAKKEAALAIFADIETIKQADIAANTVIEGTNSERVDIATSFGEETSQSLNNITLSGGSFIRRQQTIHPITKNPIYVSVFAVSAKSAADAIQMEKANYAAAFEIKSHQANRLTEKNNWSTETIATEEQVGKNKKQAKKSPSVGTTILNADDIDDDTF